MAAVPVITTHPDRAAIEIGLANGVPLRALSARYGLSMSQLSRYRSEHMDDALIARLRVRGCRSDEEMAELREIESKSLLDHFAWQRSRLYLVADRAGKIGLDNEEIRALAEAGRTSERIGKLLGEMGAANLTINAQINFTADPRWHAIRTELVRALKPHPAAWQAAVTAIERAEAVPMPMPTDARVIEHAPSE